MLSIIVIIAIMIISIIVIIIIVLLVIIVVVSFCHCALARQPFVEKVPPGGLSNESLDSRGRTAPRDPMS